MACQADSCSFRSAISPVRQFQLNMIHPSAAMPLLPLLLLLMALLFPLRLRYCCACCCSCCCCCCCCYFSYSSSYCYCYRCCYWYFSCCRCCSELGTKLLQGVHDHVSLQSPLILNPTTLFARPPGFGCSDAGLKVHFEGL